MRRLPTGAGATATAPLRFVSAASLFDGHDAAINIIRRLLQAHGAEVVHLGHNRSVADIVRAAIQEDADGIAVQFLPGRPQRVLPLHGRHAARARRGAHPHRRRRRRHDRAARDRGTRGLRRRAHLHARGRPQARPRRHDRRRHRARAAGRSARRSSSVRSVRATTSRSRARSRRSSTARTTRPVCAKRCARPWRASAHRTPVVGITGTGGAGKSSLTDELLMRFVRHFPDRNIAVVAMDPTRRRSGGALLGDRIRMNSLAAEQVFMRSLATRRQNLATSAVLADVLNLLRYAGFDLDRRRDGRHRPERLRDRRPRRRADVRDDERVRRGEPAREDRHARLRRPDRAQQVREARRRGRAARRAQAVAAQSRRVPAAGRRRCRCSRPSRAASTIRASTACSRRCARGSTQKLGEGSRGWAVADPGPTELVERHALVPAARTRYLAEIAANGRRARDDLQHRAEAASRANSLHEALRALGDPRCRAARALPRRGAGRRARTRRASRLRGSLQRRARRGRHRRRSTLLRQWPALAKSATDDEYCYACAAARSAATTTPRR